MLTLFCLTLLFHMGVIWITLTWGGGGAESTIPYNSVISKDIDLRFAVLSNFLVSFQKYNKFMQIS